MVKSIFADKDSGRTSGILFISNLSLIIMNHNMLTRAAGGRAPTRSITLRKGVVMMSTYEELQLIVSVAVLIVAILTYTHKK